MEPQHIGRSVRSYTVIYVFTQSKPTFCYQELSTVYADTCQMQNVTESGRQ